MMLSAYVAGPYSGVSQVPPQVRLPDACEDMVNCIATIPNGIQKRPPLVFQGIILSSGARSDLTFQEVPRGSPSLDLGLILNNVAGVVSPHLFLLSAPATPIAVTVTTPAQSYLNLNDPSPISAFRGTAIEDFVFITNRTVAVANGTATQATRPFESLIWVKTGEYGRVYSVQVQQPPGNILMTATYRPSTGGSAGDALGVGTDVIADGLVTGNVVTGSGGSVSADHLDTLNGFGFTVVRIGSLISLVHPTTDYVLQVVDDQGNLAMEGIKGSVEAFSDLPAVAVDGFTVEISQDQAGGKGSFYVQFQAGTTTTTGTWKEVTAPGANLGLDPTTMPVALEDTISGWKLDTAVWTGRTTGDTTLVPDPGFIADFITDVTWWRGRLVLLYNGGSTLSASDSPFKFYTTTLATDLDSDSVGFLTPVDRKSFFKQALTFDQRLFLFADRCQAAITTSGGAPTPSSALITTIAESAFSDSSKVQKGNHKVYYLVDRTSSALLYGLSIDRLSGLALEEDLSPAIPQYLPVGIDRAATWEADYITVYGKSGTGTLYVRVYREQDYQRVQNAFFSWVLPQGYTCSGLLFKNAILYLVLLDGTGKALLFTMDTTPNQITQGPTTNSTVPQFLDFMINESEASSVAFSGGLTTFTLPISALGAPWLVSLRAPSDGYPEGYLPVITHQTATTVTLKGDFRTALLWFGIPYASYFIPTKWYATGSDKKPMHDGRLSMKRLKADIAKYGYLRAEVTVKGRATRLYLYEGYNQDDLETPMDFPPNSATQVLNVPLAGSNEDVQVKFINDSHLGFKFLGYEWRADWNPTSRRVT